MSFLTVNAPDFSRVDVVYMPKVRTAQNVALVFMAIAFGAAVSDTRCVGIPALIIAVAFMARRLWLLRRLLGVENRAFRRAFERVRGRA